MAQLQKVDQGRYELSGELTFESVPDLWNKTNLLADNVNEIYMDLSSVDRFDSAALALLIGWMETLEKANRALKLVHVPSKMLDIARVSGVDGMLHIDSQ